MTLRVKFIFWICLLFILMGAFIFISLSIILPKKITAQILKRDINIAQYLSREIQEPLLTNNKLALRLLLKDRQEGLEDIMYIFIRARDGSIIASTFDKRFPRGLLGINKPSSGTREAGGEAYRIEKFLVNGKRVYDIATPLLRGELGSLHLGVSLDSSKKDIAEFAKINYYVAVAIFIGLGTGILIFASLGILLSNRIVKLKNFAVSVGRGNFDEKIDIKSEDELGSMASSFNEMARNLKEKVETIKRLSYLEERGRIAFELHDGLAQNMADIIKRLELCERLFKLEPSRALEELKELKANTKESLNNIRQTIFNLKLAQDSDFNFHDNLMDYLQNFQQQHNINVKLDVNWPLGEIATQKARSIFYIVRESLVNIKKHSLAKNVSIALRRNNRNELTINIKDDGRGFDIKAIESASNAARFGIIGMRERVASIGGTFDIRSKSGEGAEVSVVIPLEEKVG